jgi:undecaprenyl diphosphate synthase
MDFYRQNGIRIRHAGDFSGLPADIQKEIRRAMEDTGKFTGLQVILALNYGGRDEICRAMGRLLGDREAAGKTITEELVRRYLDNPDVPDPDLVIRTAGEYRTSNFLLWEAAYSEYYVSDILWPDWTEADFKAAVADFQKRERRYGGVPQRVDKP